MSAKSTTWQRNNTSVHITDKANFVQRIET